MTETIRIFLSAVVVVLVVFGATACEKIEPSTTPAEGAKNPVEQVSKQLDEAAEKTTARMKEALESAEKGVEKAGDRIQDAAQDAQAKIEEAKKEK